MTNTTLSGNPAASARVWWWHPKPNCVVRPVEPQADGVWWWHPKPNCVVPEA